MSWMVEGLHSLRNGLDSLPSPKTPRKRATAVREMYSECESLIGSLEFVASMPDDQGSKGLAKLTLEKAREINKEIADIYFGRRI